MGWSIWWDRRIPIGKSYDEAIQSKLDAADCVIVVWTRHSIASRWVRSEAERAANRRMLMPVLMEDVEPPLGFSLLQAANLIDWRGEQTHAGFSQLIQQLSAVLIPNGATSLDKRPTEGMRPHSRQGTIWTIFTLLGVALLILAALSLTHLSEVDIVLRAQATEVRFVSSAEQELSGLLVLGSLNVAGLRQIHFPRSEDLPGRTVTSHDLRGTIVSLSDGGPASSSGAITLEPLALSDRTSARLSANSGQAQVNIALEDTHQQIRVNVQDQVEVQLPKMSPAILKFGNPKPLLLEPGRSSVELSLSFSGYPVHLTPAPVSVKDLAFYRVEERVIGQQTIVRKIPTILRGKLRIAESTQSDLTLSKGATIDFAEAYGEIEAIRFLEDRIELDFRGKVRGLKLCFEGDCSNLMPTRLEWMMNQLRSRL
jgi:hypothetical protein